MVNVWPRTDARNLNFEVIDQLIEAGIDPKDLLDDLIKADDAYNINSSLAFIVRVSDFDELLEPGTLKELETYDK